MGDEFDPTKTDDRGTTGGASGGGDEDPRNWALPDTPTDTSDKRRSFWPGGARPKDPYAYQKLPMSEFPKEKSGLPRTPNRGPRSEETSFTEGGIPETSTPENTLSEEDQEKVSGKGRERRKTKMAECKSKSS